MLRALSIAAAGMNAQQTHVEIVANNLANINTTGFKRAKAEFADLLYQRDSSGIADINSDQPSPEGSEVGLGVRTATVRNIQTQGALTATGNAHDLALSGRGWFQVARNGGTSYTRAGAFGLSATGQLVTSDGFELVPPISVPAEAVEVKVSDQGIVTAIMPGQIATQPLGQITVTLFANDAGLQPMGGNLFKASAASGPGISVNPGESGAGEIRQGYLESSNVDPIREVTELISAQRAFEMNSKVIQTVDEMARAVTRS